jgi:hypothetical protein
MTLKKMLARYSRTDWIFLIVGAIGLALMLTNLLHPALGMSIAMMGLGRPILTQQDLDQHRTALATQDIIYAPLYDSSNYATAGQNQLVFFTSPLGQGTTTAPSASGSKTLADTNMTAAGQLTKGNEFFMIGQELMLFPGQAPEGAINGAGGAVNGFLNDTYTIGKSGFLTLQIGSNRNYIQDGPLMIFPPSARLAVQAAYGGTSTAGTQSITDAIYAAWTGEPYAITPVYIEATQGFQEVIQWPALVTTNATARLFSRLRGYLIRNAQ